MSMVSLRTLPADGARPRRARPRPRPNVTTASSAATTTSATIRKAFDEMFDAAGQRPRPVQGHLRRACPVGCLRVGGPRPRRWAARSSTRASPSRCRGRSGRSRWTWCPRVISAAEWSRLERGIKQRVKALEMFLDDIYGEQEILRDGVIPRRLDHLLRALPPRGRGHRAAQRRADPRRGHRPGPRRPGHVPRARGQPALAVGRLLRDGEPPHDGAGLPQSVRHAPGARGRRLRLAPAARAAQRGRLQRSRPDGRGAHPGRLQLRVLRALAAGPADGRRTRRGPRPVLPRQHRVHADHRGRAAGRRHLPPHRRRVPRPDALQARLGARRGGSCSMPRARATS